MNADFLNADDHFAIQNILLKESKCNRWTPEVKLGNTR